MAYDPFWRTRPLQYSIILLYSILIAVVWPLIFAVRRILRFLGEFGAESNPCADGTITTGDVRVIHGWILDYAVCELIYTYRVRDEYYSGTIVRQFADEQVAWDFVNARRGKTAQIRYKEQKSGASVLLESDQTLVWNPEPSPTFLAQLWRHWSDELRREPTQ